MNKSETESLKTVVNRIRKRKSVEKVPVYLKLDKEAVDWFRSKGKGYQAFMNEVLREFVRECSSREETEHMRIESAQSLYRRFYTQCFWHMKPDLKIALSDIPKIVEGLRKFGGREGFIEAAKLCQ